MLSSAALLLVCTLMYVLVIGLFVLFPPYHKVSGVGAVMSLAPQAERLPTAAQHYGNGGAQYIVISRPLGSVTTDPSVIPSLADNLCRSEDISIICLPPDGADTTLGEARMLARLVSEREWNSLVIVTSSDHAFRAGQIFKPGFTDADSRLVISRVQ